jgi:cellulose synthase/poly-beta-1,6-N-acetylglucosamine synthase-like glycosyltransferase
VNARHQLVDIVVPVHNEEAVLEPNVRLLRDYLRSEYPFRFAVVVADNASTDATPAIAARLAADEPEVRLLRLARKGRGLALRTAWLASGAGTSCSAGTASGRAAGGTQQLRRSSPRARRFPPPRGRPRALPAARPSTTAGKADAIANAG